MTDHTVHFYLDPMTQRVEAEIACHVLPDAGICRTGSCPKGCEEFSIEGPDAAGRWWHDAYDEATDDNTDRHYLEPYDESGGECNYKDWIDNGEGVIDEYNGDRTPVRDAPIEFDWDGDHYEWHFADDATEVQA